MIVEFELVKRETDQVIKRLVQEWHPDDASDQYIRYSEKTQDLLRDGYVIESTRIYSA